MPSIHQARVLIWKIRHHISDRLALYEAEQNEKCPFTKADVLLCRNEDVLWFETKDGRMEYLHPLSIEGLCIDGLLDYQFRQTSRSSFEMIAEISTPFVKETVGNGIKRQMQTLLNKNGLADIRFSIRFTTKIMPDINTGKKLLIVRQEEQDMIEKKEYRQEYLTGERALFQGENLKRWNLPGSYRLTDSVCCQFLRQCQHPQWNIQRRAWY